MKVTVTISLLLLFLSCDSKERINLNLNRECFKSEVYLDSIDTISFMVADTIIHYGLGIQQYDSLFTFKPVNNRHILLYNKKTREFVGSIKTSNKDSYNYHIHNRDTIFFYNQWKNQLDIINFNGNITDRIKIKPTIDFSPNPDLKINPIFFIDGYLYLTGMVPGETELENTENRLVTIKYDVKNKTHEYLMPYPELYRKANWSGNLFRYPFIDYNPDKKLFVYSFPISHDLYTLCEKENKIDSFYGGSQFINRIVPISLKKNFILNTEDELMNYKENMFYGKILYDKYRDVYYRFAELKSFGKTPNAQSQRERSIIIMNSNFKIIGESKLPLNVSATNCYMSFVDKNGLWLFLDQKDESRVFYEIYQLKKYDIKK